MDTILSFSQANEQTISFVLPPGIPMPRFSFNQRVEAVSGAHQGCTGTIRGLEYMDLNVAQHMGFDYEGWSYTVSTDETNKKFFGAPHALCDEEDLRAI